MVRIEKYDEEIDETITRFKLIESGSGVKLVVVDTDGDRIFSGSILRIGEDGKLHRYDGMNESLPLDLDDRGAIKDGDKE